MTFPEMFNIGSHINYSSCLITYQQTNIFIMILFSNNLEGLDHSVKSLLMKYSIYFNSNSMMNSFFFYYLTFILPLLFSQFTIWASLKCLHTKPQKHLHTSKLCIRIILRSLFIYD